MAIIYSVLAFAAILVLFASAISLIALTARGIIRALIKSKDHEVEPQDTQLAARRAALQPIQAERRRSGRSQAD